MQLKGLETAQQLKEFAALTEPEFGTEHPLHATQDRLILQGMWKPETRRHTHLHIVKNHNESKP